MSRRNYRETDRIITVITPDYGKISLVARGTRVLKSKLAGGIELFTVDDINFVRGKGDLATLVSSRLKTNYPEIIKSIDRVRLGYELLSSVEKLTESGAESEYFDLLHAALEGLNDLNIDNVLIRLWFNARMIAISGHAPNLVSNSNGKPLTASGRFIFNSDAMSFESNAGGRFGIDHIKYLRIVFASGKPNVLARINGSVKFAQDLSPLVNLMHSLHLSS